MSSLVIAECIPTDVVDLVATHPERDRPIRVTTWTGIVVVRPDVDDATPSHDQAVSCFLPDSRPFRNVAMTGSRTAVRVASAGLPTGPGDPGRLEVQRASATVSPDPRGGEHAWLELHIQVRAAGLVTSLPWRLSYQVTLVIPHKSGTPPVES